MASEARTATARRAVASERNGWWVVGGGGAFLFWRTDLGDLGAFFFVGCDFALSFLNPLF